MALSDFSIRRPVFSWLLMAAALLLGIIPFRQLNVSQLPYVDFPVVNISLRLEGAIPEVMETLSSIRSRARFFRSMASSL